MEHNIVIYSTSTCHYCQLAKNFFRSKNIEFTEYNVGLDPEKRTEMINMTGQMGVPVIVIDGKAMVGFSEERMEDLLSGKPLVQASTEPESAESESQEQQSGAETNNASENSSGSMWDKVRGMLGMK